MNAAFDRISGAYVVNLKDQAGRVGHAAGGGNLDQALDQSLVQAGKLALASPLGKYPAVRVAAGLTQSKIGRDLLKTAGRMGIKIVRQRIGR